MLELVGIHIDGIDFDTGIDGDEGILVLYQVPVQNNKNKMDG